MSSRIEQLIDEIEEYIDNCKPQAFSSTKIIVNKDEIDELLRELRMKTPDEIKRYQKIISNKEAILNDAQANEVVTMATRQAQEILDNATLEANNVRMSAMQYMDDMLANLENIIAASSQTAAADYETLLGNLNHYHEIIQSNRSELHPVEELVEVDYDGQDNHIDVI